MARKTVVLMTDDLDGESEATESIEYAVDGVAYVIDLNKKNHDAFRKILDKYTSASRKVGKVAGQPSITTRRGTGAKADKDQNTAIREWAKTADIEISDRGRIPGSVILKFEEAHKAQ